MDIGPKCKNCGKNPQEPRIFSRGNQDMKFDSEQQNRDCTRPRLQNPEQGHRGEARQSHRSPEVPGKPVQHTEKDGRNPNPHDGLKPNDAYQIEVRNDPSGANIENPAVVDPWAAECARRKRIYVRYSMVLNNPLPGADVPPDIGISEQQVLDEKQRYGG